MFLRLRGLLYIGRGEETHEHVIGGDSNTKETPQNRI
jgi:hypothetical protein